MKKNSENTNTALTLKPAWGSDTAEAGMALARLWHGEVCNFFDWLRWHLKARFFCDFGRSQKLESLFQQNK